MNAPKPLRKLGSRLAYNAISLGIKRALPELRDGYEPFKDADVLNSSYMNYGYLDAQFEAEPLELPEIIDPSRTCIQLYHHVATQTDLVGKDVLEVGCGRGGGASWVAGLGPRRMVGVDLSPVAIDFCRRVHARENLGFMVGDACDLPLDDNEFDVVVNVESSHCYPSMPGFLSEVRRVLRPGGMFAWADVRFDDQRVELEQAFATSGFEFVSHHEITDNVVAALDEVAPMRQPYIKDMVPAPLRPMVRSALALPGTPVYDALASGRLRYFCKLVRRPPDDQVWIDYPFDFSAEDQFDPNRGKEMRRQRRTWQWVDRYFRWRFEQPR
ncbi:class I SAM-dependent methyltransferase [Enhygromyxa salina]|nr:class I SAM-dependent methyltransferase [Enhygromyxa salina]